ncbi:MAG: OadG family protein [Magnetococcales bacterium]|nr:OadG family protein [Magnetococcales bacterium]
MSIVDLINKGVELMFLGMGTVFIFLAILVVVVSQMSKLAKALEKNQPQPTTAKPATVVATNNDHIAAIAAAVHQYRAKHQ